MTKSDRLRQFHFWMTVAWTIVLALAVGGFFIESLVFLLGVKFISVCSIYANQIGHFSAYQASRSGSLADDASEFSG